MLRQGPISLTVHALAEPLIAALFIAAPFLFGFSDQSAPTAVAVVAGVLILFVGMSTRWRVSLVKVIPITAHALIDLVTAGVLIAAPFLFGFSDQTAPTAFFLVMGVLDLLVALGTRWAPPSGGPADAADGAAGGGRRRRRGRRGASGSQPTP